MLEKQKQTIDIHEYWQIFVRRKWFFIIPFCLCIIGGTILCSVLKPQYESTTVIQVSTEQNLSRGLDGLVPGTTPEQRTDNLRNLITSHAYLKRLINILNLYNDPKMQKIAEKNRDKFMELTIEEITELFWIEYLRSHISIGNFGDFIQIGATTNSAAFAYDLVKTLSQVFIDEYLRLEVGGIREAHEFSSDQFAIYKQKLDEGEERLRNFRETLVRDEFEDEMTIAAKMDNISSLLTTTDIELREANNRLASLGNQIDQLKINYKVPNSILLNNLKAQLLDAITDLPKLMIEYSWEDGRILKIYSLIDDLKDKIQKEIEREIMSQYLLDNSNVNIIVQREIIRIEIDFLKRKKEALANLSNTYKSKLAKSQSKEITLSRLKAEVEASREIYQRLQRQTRGTEIEQALQKTSAEFKFKVIEPPRKAIKPNSPKPLRITFFSILLGSVLGFGLISLLEYSDHSFKNVENIEKFLKLPVIGTMPHINMEESYKNRGNQFFNNIKLK